MLEDVTNGEGSQPTCVLALDGPLDIATATEAHKRLLELELPRHGRLMVDLRDVTFMDSTGIRLLLHAREHARRCGASFAIVRGADDVMRVLALVGLDEQLDIVASREPAATAAR
jgi:anti-anti-sigma factor